jgi:hypothetical protein
VRLEPAPAGPPAAAQRARTAASSPLTLARQASLLPASAPARVTPPASGTGAASTGGDSDLAYRELLRRLQQEQEQLGQLIPHPF